MNDSNNPHDRFARGNSGRVFSHHKNDNVWYEVNKERASLVQVPS